MKAVQVIALTVHFTGRFFGMRVKAARLFHVVALSWYNGKLSGYGRTSQTGITSISTCFSSSTFIEGGG